jgi:putative ABC transport system ATP-binding protein
VLQPGAGRVQVGDNEVSALAEAPSGRFRARSIGFVFQDFALLDDLSAEDNILHPYRICSALRLSDGVRARARTLAQRLGVADRLHRRPGALSQGERQRVAICRALLPAPLLLLADEATGNLDPANKQAILDLLFETVETDGTTLVAVTQDQELLARFDRVVDFLEFTANQG